ncbi:MAG TPA: MFS transporter [Rhodocyclaceae bacterium]|nr:MFS transporter [Rhodocyclaceae bacterium]
MTARQKQFALAAVVAAYMLSFFHRFAPAGIAQDLAAAFSTSATSLGALAATYFYVYTLMQVPTGILADTLGPKRLLVGGALIASAGSVAFGLADSLDGALVGRTLIGLGVSVTFIAMLKLIALWYDERRFASLVGLAMLLGNFGSVLAGTPLTGFAQAFGWRTVFFLAAGLSLLTALACWFTISEKRQEQRLRFDRTVILGGLAQVLRNRATWPALLANFGIAGSFFAFAGLWATPYLTTVHGLSRVAAASHLSLYFAGFALGCFVIGTISDRLGKRKPVLVGGALAYLGFWLLWLSALPLPDFATYPLFALMGLATSCFSLTWACAKEVNPPQLSGTSTSVVNMGGFLAGALLQPAIGRLMDFSWQGGISGGARIYTAGDYQLGLLLPAGAALAGTVATFFLRETGCRNVSGAR